MLTAKTLIWFGLFFLAGKTRRRARGMSPESSTEGRQLAGIVPIVCDFPDPTYRDVLECLQFTGIFVFCHFRAVAMMAHFWHYFKEEYDHDAIQKRRKIHTRPWQKMTASFKSARTTRSTRGLTMSSKMPFCVVLSGNT